MIGCGLGASAAWADTLDELADRLFRTSVVLVRSDGARVALRRRGDAPPETVSEGAIVAALSGVQLSEQQTATLWDIVADTDNGGLLTLPIVRGLIMASASPASREAMWIELGSLAEQKQRSRSSRGNLLGFLEQNRAQLLPLLDGVATTEAAGNAIVDVMAASRLLGEDVEQSLRWIGARYPEAIARRIQRERELGRPVKWEFAGFEQLVLWKDRHMVRGGAAAATTLAGLDDAGETFAVLFNSLYPLDEWYRQQMLRGLGPIEAFDIVNGGEAELYRMGTSSFRKYLHPLVMRGIAESGSFEAFLDRATRGRWGNESSGVSGRRGMVYLRAASAFGLLAPVIATVRDQSAFIATAIEALGEPATFESNASVLVDLVAGGSTSDRAIVAFRRQLLERLYEQYGRDLSPARKGIYGSLLSVYQTLTGDRRDPSIDRAFPLDEAKLHTPFEALFSPARDGGHVHRMLMRFDRDVDGSSNFASFRALMSERGADVHSGQEFEVYRLRKGSRSVEIYVNRPSASDFRRGIDALGKLLDDVPVHSVVGRGHSGIIGPLRKDATMILGPRARQVAAVVVGTCGGTSSVRSLIDTFGYVQFISTRSTGRQILNNAIIAAYMTELLALEPGARLTLAQVLSKALARFLRTGNEGDLREDAGFYHVNTAEVYAAMLFDRHVRGNGPDDTIATNRSAEARPTRSPLLDWQPLASRRASRAVPVSRLRVVSRDDDAPRRRPDVSEDPFASR